MQKLQIHNFRQIDDATIEVTKYLLLIGEQASGKSTIAKLLYFFKSLPQDYLAILYSSQNEHIGKIKNLFIRKIQDKFNQYFGMTGRLSDDFYIKYCYDTESDSYIILKKNKNLCITFDSNYWNRISADTNACVLQIQRLELPSSSNSFAIQERRKNSILQQLRTLTSQLFFDSNECMFFPAGRNITVSYPEQFQYLFYGVIDKPIDDKRHESNTIDLTLMKEFVGYSKLLIDHFAVQPQFIDQTTPMGKVLAGKVAEILHGTYNNDSGFEKIRYEGDEYIPLKLSSSGQQESIRIIQDLIYIWSQKIQASRIVEELETHLYPVAQKLLVDLMVLVANKVKGQIILTTHSPFILSAFNNLLFYNKVLSSDMQKAQEIARHFGVESLNGTDERLDVSPADFRAYALKPGCEEYCKSIFDKETQLIGENYIDEATENIYADFDFLYNLI